MLSASVVANSNCSFPVLPSDELNALKSLYDSTSGPTWNCIYQQEGIPWNFSTNENPCGNSTWIGLECRFGCIPETNPTTNNTVTYLNLYGCGLSGTLPSEIGYLSNVDIFSLSQNSIRNSIPDTISKLNSTYLSLSTNLMTGTIPSVLGQLGNVEILDLSSNHLNGTIPSQLAEMTTVALLFLDFNSLTGTLPTSLALLPRLEFLSASVNKLQSNVPTDFALCSSLALLDLNSNHFSGQIPSGLFSLPQLVNIDFGANLLTGSIPVEISSASFLAILNLASNQLTGTIPPNIGTPAYLDSLSLDVNYLTGPVPTKLAAMSHLQSITLTENMLTGNIPNFGAYPALQVLYVHDNCLEGQLPSSLFGYIEYLDVSQNHLTGSLPEFSVDLGTNLAYFLAYKNGLTGTIPRSLTRSMPLYWLDVGNNSFEGNISFIDDMMPLSTFVADGNYFTGSIPSSIGNTKISQIVVSHNYFTGTLPSSIGLMSGLQVVLSARNFLTGQPGNLFNVSSQIILTAIDFSFNDFTGTIPAEVFQLPILGTFSAVKTCFHGSLPLSICNASALKVLLLDGVTSGLSCQKRIEFINTDNNAFYSTNGPVAGGIPSCIWVLPALQSLQLSSNSLTGTIAAPPVTSQLRDVVLAYNQLTGTIPLSLQNLPMSSILKLSNNRLTGTYDGTAAAQNSKYVLDLHNNRLSGFLPTSLQNATNLNVMQGNLFDCDASHPKPPYDEYQNVTSCGSQELDNALCVWGASLGVFTLIVALAACVLEAAAAVETDRSPRNPSGLLDAEAGRGVREGRGSSDGSADNMDHQIWYFVVSWAKSYLLRPLLGVRIVGGVGCTVGAGGTGLDQTGIGSRGRSPIKEYNSKAGGVIHTHSIDKAAEGGSIELLTCRFLAVAADTIELLSFAATLRQCAHTCVKVVAIILVVCMPVYAGLKLLPAAHSYSTHTYQYSWLVSSTFLSGDASAICVVLIWSLCALVIAADIYAVNDRNKQKEAQALTQAADSVTRQADSARGRFKLATSSWASLHAMAYTGLVLSMLVASIVGANALYLYITLSTNFSPTSQTAAQLGLALFKFLWNVAVIPTAIASTRYCAQEGGQSKQKGQGGHGGQGGQGNQSPMQEQVEHGQGTAREASSTITDNTSDKSFHRNVILKFFCYVINNVAAPVIVTIFADSSCLYDLIVNESAITEAFKYNTARLVQCFVVPANLTDLFHFPEPVPPKVCYDFGSALELVSTFYPPFTYGYQCSSAILVNYVPVLVYSYSMQAVFLPIMHGIFFWYFVRVDKTSSSPLEASGDEIIVKPGAVQQQYCPPIAVAVSAVAVRGVRVPVEADTNHGSKVQEELSPTAVRIGSLDAAAAAADPSGSAHTPSMSCASLLDSLSQRMKGVVRPFSTRKTEERLLAASTTAASLMQSLMVLLTFGVSSPPLAAVIFVAVTAQVIENLFLLDVFLAFSPRCRRAQVNRGARRNPRWSASPALSSGGNEDSTGGLNDACFGVWTAPRAVCWWLVHVSSLFWAVMVFDMVGDTDANNPVKALWASILVLCLPFAMRLLVELRSHVTDATGGIMCCDRGGRVESCDDDNNAVRAQSAVAISSIATESYGDLDTPVSGGVKGSRSGDMFNESFCSDEGGWTEGQAAIRRSPGAAQDSELGSVDWARNSFSIEPRTLSDNQLHKPLLG